MLKDEINHLENDYFYLFLKRLELEPLTWDDLYSQLRNTRSFDNNTIIVEVKNELLRLRHIEQNDDIIFILDNGRDYILGNEEYIEFLKNHCAMAADQ